MNIKIKQKFKFELRNASKWQILSKKIQANWFQILCFKQKKIIVIIDEVNHEGN